MEEMEETEEKPTKCGCQLVSYRGRLAHGLAWLGTSRGLMAFPLMAGSAVVSTVQTNQFLKSSLLLTSAYQQCLSKTSSPWCGAAAH